MIETSHCPVTNRHQCIAGRGESCDVFFEPLESRMLLSVPGAFDFWAVGAIDNNSSLSMYVVDGSVDAAGTVSGTLTLESQGWANGSPVDWGTMSWQDNGSFRMRTTNGSPWTHSTGAQFLSADGQSLGWHQGTRAGEYDYAAIIESRTTTAIADFNGTWDYSMVFWDSKLWESESVYGQLTFSNGILSMSATDSMGTEVIGDSISTVSNDGKAVSNAGFHYYLSRDGQSLLFALNLGGDSLIAAAVRVDAAPTRDQVVGSYLTMSTSPDNISNGEDTFSSIITLSSNGSYANYDLRQYQAGNPNPDEIGSWSLSGNTVTINTTDGVLAVIKVSANASSSVIQSASILGIRGEIAGIASKISNSTTVSVPSYEFSIAGLRDGGQPAVWEQFGDNQWREYDLLEATGAPALAGDIQSWTDPRDGLSYAAGVSFNGDLILFHHESDGTWSFRNLTQETDGSLWLTSDIQVMTSPDGNVNITVLDINGDLILYSQDGSTTSPGNYRWSVMDLGQNLRGQGQQMPAFTGKLASYATAWGGLNIAGLDASGAIHSVWWAPGMFGWTASNLSTITGAAPIVGGLAVYLTPWKGINIAGINAAGHLQVTWWVPSFGGNWVNSDLTNNVSGPILDPNSVSSYVSSWGGLNVTGLDQTTGKVKVYWWAPGMSSWSITTLSDNVGAGQPIITTMLTGMAPSNSSLNVFGYDSTGDLIRYFWEPGGTWTAENLMEDSLLV